MRKRRIAGKAAPGPSRLRAARFFSGKTLDEIAVQSSIDRSRPSRLERGLYPPSKDEKTLLVRVLGIPRDVLFPPEKDPET